MEKIINLLNDIETKADKILSRVSDDKARINEEMNQKMKLFDSKIEMETNQKLDAIRKKADMEVESELIKMKHEQQNYLQQLDENFEENCERYANQIFQCIITI